MKILNSRIEYLQSVNSLIPISPICMEIGVMYGDFSQNIFDVINPSKLYLIDPFQIMADPITKLELYPNTDWGTVYSTNDEYEKVSQRFQNQINNGSIIIKKNLSTEVIDNFEDNTLDFIYIDACHLYESVLWDMENYFSKLKVGGYLGGHDYVDIEFFGVKRAVNEFCEKYNYEIILLVENSGDWLLSPKRS